MRRQIKRVQERHHVDLDLDLEGILKQPVDATEYRRQVTASVDLLQALRIEGIEADVNAFDTRLANHLTFAR